MELLAIIVISLSTTICTKIMYNNFENEVMLDLMDRNLKVEPKNMPAVIFKNEKEANTLFIPFYNIYKMFKFKINYERKKRLILNDISNNPNVEYLTLEEEKEYSSTPNVKTAKIINKRFEKDIKTSSVMDYIIDNKVSNIYYKLNNTKDDLVVLKVIGPLKEESKNKIKERILNAWITIYYDEESKKTSPIDIEKAKEKNKIIKEDLDIRNTLLLKKKELENIKKELVELYNKSIYNILTEEEEKKIKELVNKVSLIDSQVHVLTKKITNK